MDYLTAATASRSPDAFDDRDRVTASRPRGHRREDTRIRRMTDARIAAAFVRQAVNPPSTLIAAPVMYAPSELARWATVAAISAAPA